MWICVGALAGLLAFGTGTLSASPSVPVAVGPRSGSAVQNLPAFAWNPVRGADAYEFQLAPDPNFKTGANRFITGNTRATLTRTVPNGTYWWRVRALTKSGNVSGWSSTRSIRKRWFPKVRLLWPTGTTVQFPRTPLTLRWASVPGAAKYLVSFGTHKDESSSASDCDSLVGDRPVETAATSYTVNVTPATGPNGSAKTYYWSVTPLDPQRNRGDDSSCASFHWQWPSATKVSQPPVDLRPSEPETFDPQFSWQPVPGAARYEVEINSSEEWSTGSKVCCTQPVIGTSISPTRLFRDNTYYWRVRPINADGNAGVWSPSGLDGRFEKVFDRAAALGIGTPSIKNLHLRDNHGDIATGASTSAPIAVWDPVPGASSYQVEVAPFAGFCDWTAVPGEHWLVTTATTAWTPLGRFSGSPPYPTARMTPAQEGQRLKRGQQYCIRVRARADRDERGQDISGDFTYLGGADAPAFTYAGNTGTATRGYLAPGDYGSPKDPTKPTSTPYFTWEPTKGQSWFVLVAKDPDFHTVIDYAFTTVPAYAPRRGLQPITYADETTKYYWAVLPSGRTDGVQALGDPLSANAASFQKQSILPKLSRPERDAGGQVVFRWTAVDGARKYRLQVSRDADFGTLLDDVVTNSIAYTSNKSYPADVCLFWRVRAETEDGVGLAWSKNAERSDGCGAAGSFKRSWPNPPRLVEPGDRGDEIPTIRWMPVVGAVWYDLHVEQPGYGPRDYLRLRSAAATFTRMTGTGNFRWKVRADFGSVFGAVPGPWSPWHRFTRTIGPPKAARAAVGRRSVVFSWAAKAGIKNYVVEVARKPDFRRRIELTRTDETTYAPLLTSTYRTTKVFYWRVAAVDEGGNSGAFTKPQRFRLSLPR